MWKLLKGIAGPQICIDTTLTNNYNLNAWFDNEKSVLLPAIESHQIVASDLLFRSAENITTCIQKIVGSPILYLLLGIPLDIDGLEKQHSMPQGNQKYVGKLGLVELELVGPSYEYNNAQSNIIPYLWRPYNMTRGAVCTLYGFLEWRHPFEFHIIKVEDQDYKLPWDKIAVYTNIKQEPEILTAGVYYNFTPTGIIKVKEPLTDGAIIHNVTHSLINSIINQEYIMLNNLNLYDLPPPLDQTKVPVKKIDNFNNEVMQQLARRHQNPGGME